MFFFLEGVIDVWKLNFSHRKTLTQTSLSSSNLTIWWKPIGILNSPLACFAIGFPGPTVVGLVILRDDEPTGTGRGHTSNGTLRYSSRGNSVHPLCLVYFSISISKANMPVWECSLDMKMRLLVCFYQSYFYVLNLIEGLTATVWSKIVQRQKHLLNHAMEVFVCQTPKIDTFPFWL